MNHWVGEVVFLVGLAAFIAIRAPHDGRRRSAGFSRGPVGGVEMILLTLMALGVVVLPLVSIFTPLFDLADRPFGMWQLAAGCICLVPALWLFYRAHADLGLNWSPLVEVRAGHALVESGVYRSVRHPMYGSILLYAVAQAFLLPNWIAGPSCLFATMLLFAGRVCREERLMIERFGEPYREYAARTKRLIPGVW